MLRKLLMASTAPVRAPEGGGGGGGGAGDAPPAVVAPAAVVAVPSPAAAAVAPAAAATAAPAATIKQPPASVLDDPKAAASAEKIEADRRAALTPEQAAAEDKAKKDAEEAAKSPEQKAAEKAAADAAAAEKKTQTLKGYDALKLPDGVDPQQPAMAKFKDVASTLGIATDAAQSLVDAVAPELRAAVEAPYNAWADMQTEWVAKIKADAEFGGDKYEASLGQVLRAVNAIGGKDAPAMKEALALTGAANNPEVFRLLFRAGRLIGEGRPALGGNVTGDGKPRPLEQVAYPTMNQATG